MRRGKFDRRGGWPCELRDTQREGQVTPEAEVGVIQRQRYGKGGRKPPEARKRQGSILLRASEGAQPFGHLDPRLQPPETGKEKCQWFLSHPETGKELTYSLTHRSVNSPPSNRLAFKQLAHILLKSKSPTAAINGRPRSSPEIEGALKAKTMKTG